MNNKLTRIGVFYDGNYFYHVSNYYAYFHERKARIDVSGLHNHIRRKVAECEGAEERYCQIVDAHYFRGRLRAQEAEQKELLLKERLFDDILSREGITNHYLPVGPFGEKGIDVWLALEAYELAIYKRFDVCVLVAGDGDFLPLVRKLNTLGTRTLLLAWDFKYADKNGLAKETKTSQALIEEVTYPILMHQIIDDRSLRNDPLINGLFYARRSDTAPSPTRAPASHTAIESSAEGQAMPVFPPAERAWGEIEKIKEGYGFIRPDGEHQSNLFFFYADLTNAGFDELVVGDRVSYRLGANDRGPCAVEVRLEDADVR